jgi:hypothetical protein
MKAADAIQFTNAVRLSISNNDKKTFFACYCNEKYVSVIIFFKDQHKTNQKGFPSDFTLNFSLYKGQLVLQLPFLFSKWEKL